MNDFYYQNKDYQRFVDANAKTYGKTPEFMDSTPTAREYMEYLIETNKDKIGEEDEERNIGGENNRGIGQTGTASADKS